MIKVHYIPELKTDHTFQEKKIISCACCELPLVDMIITSNKEDRIHQYIFLCPKCKNSSFKVLVRGHANISGHDKLKITDIHTNITTSTVTLQ
jgi:Zn finger protein HypA/HybF involved in hydrogenase expression